MLTEYPKKLTKRDYKQVIVQFHSDNKRKDDNYDIVLNDARYIADYYTTRTGETGIWLLVTDDPLAKPRYYSNPL